MREMKDSKVNYLGAIPCNWSVIKLRYLTKIRDENGIFNPECDSYIGLENIVGYSNELFPTETSYDISLQSMCKKGDVMFGKLRPYLAKVFITPFDSFCTGELLVFSEFSGDSSFLRYCLLNKCLLDDINSSTYGTKMPRANTAYILNLMIACPPIVEQERITDFLDAKCTEIDALTADIQSQIDTLEQYKRSVITEAVTKGLNPDVEMQDSGIAWIGKIPANWTFARIGSLYTLRIQKVSDRDYAPLSVTKLGILPQLETAAKTNAHDDRKLVKKGDFVINSRSDRRGSCGISAYDGSVSLINTVLCPMAGMNPEYYDWLFHTVEFANEFFRWGHGIVDDLWTTGWSDMKNIVIPKPPLCEQQQIAEFLNLKCVEIDSIITDKKTQLETLNEYKKSLIFEYVTGKKEVPAATSLTTITTIDPHTILAGIAIDSLGKAQIGKIQLVKVLYLFDYHLGLGLNTQYYRFPHGPYDIQLDSYLNTLQNRKWFKKISDSPEKYVEGENYSDFCKEKESNSVFLRAKNDLDTVISFVKTMKRTSQVERAATLFAAWNDFLLDGISPSDDQIIREVMGNWTENKANTKYDTWKDSLDKLKRSGIIPKGMGRHTLPKIQKGRQQ